MNNFLKWIPIFHRILQESSQKATDSHNNNKFIIGRWGYVKDLQS